MPVKFTEKDPRGCSVSCDLDRWNDHICTNHPVMIRNVSAVQETIQNPDLIYKSSQYESGEVFFRSNSDSSYSRTLYTKVVIDYSSGSGNVITAFPIGEIKGGIIDEPIYKR